MSSLQMKNKEVSMKPSTLAVHKFAKDNAHASSLHVPGHIS